MLFEAFVALLALAAAAEQGMVTETQLEPSPRAQV
jgi:hypothetical protein